MKVQCRCCFWSDNLCEEIQWLLEAQEELQMLSELTVYLYYI